MQRKTIWLFAVIALAAFVACGDGGKAAADAAMQALQTAYGTVKSDAAAYVPDQAKSIDEAIAAAQETLSKGDYMKALGDVQGLTSKVGELGAAVATKQAELTKAWEGLGAGLPGVVQSIQGRVEELSKARRLPPGVKKEAVEAAKSGAAVLSSTWDEAVTAFKSANLTAALAKAQTVKAKAAELLTSLGQPVPDLLK